MQRARKLREGDIVTLKGSQSRQLQISAKYSIGCFNEAASVTIPAGTQGTITKKRAPGAPAGIYEVEFPCKEHATSAGTILVEACDEDVEYVGRKKVADAATTAPSRYSSTSQIRVEALVGVTKAATYQIVQMTDGNIVRSGTWRNVPVDTVGTCVSKTPVGTALVQFSAQDVCAESDTTFEIFTASLRELALKVDAMVMLVGDERTHPDYRNRRVPVGTKGMVIDMQCVGSFGDNAEVVFEVDGARTKTLTVSREYLAVVR